MINAIQWQSNQSWEKLLQLNSWRWKRQSLLTATGEMWVCLLRHQTVYELWQLSVICWQGLLTVVLPVWLMDSDENACSTAQHCLPALVHMLPHQLINWMSCTWTGQLQLFNWMHAAVCTHIMLSSCCTISLMYACHLNLCKLHLQTQIKNLWLQFLKS